MDRQKKAENRKGNHKQNFLKLKDISCQPKKPTKYPAQWKKYTQPNTHQFRILWTKKSCYKLEKEKKMAKSEALKHQDSEWLSTSQHQYWNLEQSLQNSVEILLPTYNAIFSHKYKRSKVKALLERSQKIFHVHFLGMQLKVPFGGFHFASEFENKWRKNI